MNNFKAIPEYRDLSAKQLFDEVVPEQQPIVLRGFAGDWPMVAAAKKTPNEFKEYLCRHYNGKKVTISAAPYNEDKCADKRFFYNDDLSGFTFVSAQERLDLFLRRLIDLKNEEQGPALSMQSALTESILPGLLEDNPSDFFPNVKPRLWVGNEGVVDTHYDGTDNIACVVAGRRRFTLFAPDQTSNLYPGPLEFTPAGVPVSLVNLRKPDFDRYPRFKTALHNAYHVELAPGDALFIPMLWWHHVESLDKINGLMNYWWNGSFAEDATSPNFLDSMKIAILAMRDLTPKQRDAWRCLFDHYLFKQGVDPVSYIPKHQHHLLGELSPDYIRVVKDHFVKKITKIEAY
ncbi:cupin-like domain-containing protein [Paraglaciecola arctica]|uniref:Pass1-related protein n=1 Tax=Paraglaciecola arctica BSs20135 TaxID=493475 RepID=K6XC75_9ALTE|nr:cupin-like domain-containing protein [Paraglaciecola arctica]GAC18239.1 pass1-related protein [Paraglaciecola arctica BSs20135]